MGGYGSGRPRQKDVVDDCHAIDLTRMQRDEVLDPWFAGTVTWSVGGRPAGSIGFRIEPRDSQRWLILEYVWGDAKERVTMRVRLETTEPHFGGVRWWGRCPLMSNGVACNRRVRKLYLRNGRFGCRQCHDLTYTSCQESHQYPLIEQMARRFGLTMREAKQWCSR